MLPDLNPINQLSDIHKKSNIQKHRFERIHDIGRENVLLNVCENLLKSIISRRQIIRENKGGHIKY